MATTTHTGPRRLVLRDAAKAAPKSRRTLLGAPDPPESGNLLMHSWSDPALIQGQTYTANLAQTVQYIDPKSKAAITQPPAGSSAVNELTRTQKFKVVGSRYTLDKTLVHSVYPPPGHEDYLNTLPHILFANDQVPWSFSTDNPPTPWFALLLFAGDEISLDSTALGAITTQIKAPAVGNPGGLTQDAETKATIVSKAQLGTLLSTQINGDAWLSPETMNADLPVRAVFMPPALYASLISNPSRYAAMTHVRTVDASTLNNLDGSDIGTFAVSVCPRLYPGTIQRPTKVYAHLVVLPKGGTTVTPLKINDEKSVCALPSLYAWSWMALPAPAFNLDHDLHQLGTTIQPLRNLDKVINQFGQTNGEAWIRRRMMAGYSIAGWLPSGGEATMCVYRTMLSPIDQPRAPLPSSNNGLDMAILDTEQNVFDVTFALAWELGRLTAMSDKQLSAAICRLRGAVHKGSLESCKKALDKNARNVHRSASDLLKGLKSASGSLRDISALNRAVPVNEQRWTRPQTLEGTRVALSLLKPATKTEYSIHVPTRATELAAASPPSSSRGPAEAVDRPVYNGINSPESTDYALLLNWFFDRLYLSGIPWVNLIGDPSYVPRESIRTFYVDSAWSDVFLDGVLTVGEHFTDTDEARAEIKSAIKRCLATKNVDGHAPQVPVWGFFLRSEICQKFPDLQVTAPRAATTASQFGADVLRCDMVDDDLLMVLFDRKPGFGHFPRGIVIQPPEHQLKFSLGDIDDWSFSEDGQITQATVKLKAVTGSDRGAKVPPTDKESLNSPDLQLNLSTGLLDPEAFAISLKASFPAGSEGADGLAALVASQLVAQNPMLKLNDDNSLGALQAKMVQSTAVPPPAIPLSRAVASSTAQALLSSAAASRAQATATATANLSGPSVSSATAVAIATATSQDSAMVAQLADLTQKLQVAQTEAARVQADYDRAQKAVNDQKASVDTLQAQVDSANWTRKAPLMMQLNTAKAALAVAQSQLSASKPILDMAQTKVAALQTTVNTLKAAIAADPGPSTGPPTGGAGTPLTTAPTWESTQETLLYNAHKTWIDVRTTLATAEANQAKTLTAVEQAQRELNMSNPPSIRRAELAKRAYQAARTDYANANTAYQTAKKARDDLFRTNMLYFLEVYANDQCNEPAFINKYLSDLDPVTQQPFSDPRDWQILSTPPVDGVMSLYNVQLYNLSTQLPVLTRTNKIANTRTDPEWRRLYAVLPLSMAVLSDVVVSVVANGNAPRSFTTGIDLRIPVGPRGVLAPLRAHDPAAAAARLTDVAAKPRAGSRADFPHIGRVAPGVVLPIVRMTVDAAHWVPRVSYSPSPFPDSGTLNISIRPAAGATKPGAARRGLENGAYPDLSFVLQEVVVNYYPAAGNEGLIAKWSEHVSFWETWNGKGNGWNGDVECSCLVPVFAVDTGSGMMVRGPMRRH